MTKQDIAMLLERARTLAAEQPRLTAKNGGILRPTNATRLRAFIGELADALEAALPAEGDSEWICEAHPDLAWPHGHCPGPGCPKSVQVRLLVQQRRDLQQSVRALEGMVTSGATRIAELEAQPAEGDNLALLEKANRRLLARADADSISASTANAHADKLLREEIAALRTLRTHLAQAQAENVRGVAQAWAENARGIAKAAREIASSCSRDCANFAAEERIAGLIEAALTGSPPETGEKP